MHVREQQFTKAKTALKKKLKEKKGTCSVTENPGGVSTQSERDQTAGKKPRLRKTQRTGAAPHIHGERPDWWAGNTGATHGEDISVVPS